MNQISIEFQFEPDQTDRLIAEESKVALARKLEDDGISGLTVTLRRISRERDFQILLKGPEDQVEAAKALFA